MSETMRAASQSSSHDADCPSAVRPAHGIPEIGRKAAEFHGRSTWYRIFGLIHMLGSAEDDGPISRIRY
jgi:hypothetical protein